MREPSGDQAGNPSNASLSVTRTTSEPSAFMTYISPLPSRADVKAMRSPSGDQDGYPLSGAFKLETLASPDPSEYMVRISEAPLRSETKAILPPLGMMDVGRGFGVPDGPATDAGAESPRPLQAVTARAASASATSRMRLLMARRGGRGPALRLTSLALQCGWGSQQAR